MRLLTKLITATFVLLVTGCTGGRGPTPAAAPEADPVPDLRASPEADPNARRDWGETPLYRAAWAGDPQAIRALLEASADPRALTDHGESALHAAARRRLPHTPEVITLLADAGLDVNARNAKGQTPLHLARTDDNLPAARKLLELGADPEARDNAGRVAVSACVWDGGGGFRGWDFLVASPVESIRGCLESGIPVDARHEEGATPLALLISTRACCADFENVLREFVAAGADVNARDDHGRTPLHRAGPTIVTSALLKAGADPGARDSAGSTPMHIAASRGRGPEASLLAAAGADVNSPDKNGQTPLHVALGIDDPDMVRTLLWLGADPTALDSAGTVADPAACARWGSEAFFAFATADIVAGCVAGGADAHTIADGSQATALLFTAAASTPHAAVVAILLEAGADVHARDGFLQYTPLHHAAQSGTPEVVRALLEAGADVDAWAKGFGGHWGWGWTPLHLAARSNPDPEVVSALVEAGADLHAPGEESYHHGNTPLHYAGDNPNPDVAAALLGAGADANALSARGRTPLHEAAANASNPAVIDVLVAAGADVNSNGYAPLHSAARYNPRPEIATALIAAGADVNEDPPPLFMALNRDGVFIGGQPMPTGHSLAVVEVLVRAGAYLEQADGSGRTALHMAAIGTPAAFPLLLRLGADPNARDANGRTPLDYALRNPSLQGLEEVLRMREEMRRVRLPSEEQ
ncbi:MAG: ankyrin repeat domain-containing protein [Gemmatimonadetes bacterium]|nr:ankyrin repeat domain-containing protein [Gemmatimonadota bacterium]MCY3943348.1 ankyrin repeat domain-containing protein [Gemmatimonadota bacterium]